MISIPSATQGGVVPISVRSRISMAVAAIIEWHPWVLAIVLGCMLSGVRALTQGPDPRLLVDQYIQGPYFTLYYAAVLVGGVVMLSSAAFRGLRDRLMVEQAGLWIVCGALLIYQTAIIIKFGAPLGVAAVITMMIAVGGVGRIGRILWELHLLNGESQ